MFSVYIDELLLRRAIEFNMLPRQLSFRTFSAGQIRRVIKTQISVIHLELNEHLSRLDWPYLSKLTEEEIAEKKERIDELQWNILFLRSIVSLPHGLLFSLKGYYHRVITVEV